MKPHRWVALGLLSCLRTTSAVSQTPAAPPLQARSTVVGDGRQVPAGTVLHVRLRQTVSSFGSKAEMPVSAILTAPVRLNGETVLPLGAELRGTVVKVQRIGLGFARETAQVGLSFDTLRLPDEPEQAVRAKVSHVDNSRETVDALGTIHGIRATASASKMLSGFAVSAASLDPMSLLFGLSASLSAFRIPESEIILPTGAELQLVTETPIAVVKSFPDPAAVTTDQEGKARLVELAKSLPYRTETEAKKEPSDITSLMILGDEATIIRALEAAGWARADALSAGSDYGVMRSVVENQGYREAPVSTLLLDGKPPVGAWAKTLDTFFQRHHLRLFAQGKEFDGQAEFVSSATHDSGIGVSKATKRMIHVIDENIDEERGKVVDDLLLTGCVGGVEYVDRPWLPKNLKNATGDTLVTDGRMAVVKMTACTSPVRADDPDKELPKAKAKASAPERIARDGVLYLRDDVYRGNIVYQGYSGVRTLMALRHKDPNGPVGGPKIVTVAGEPYIVVSRPKVTVIPLPHELRDPGARASFEPAGRPKSYASHLEYSISGGYSRFANRDFSAQPLSDVESDGSVLFAGVFINALHSGYSIAPRATIESWKYVANEFGYTYNSAPLSVTLVDTSGTVPPSNLQFDGQVRQFSYNTIFHARPNGSRFRPYAAVGPVFQLLRLYDATPSKNAILKFTIKDAGLIVDAYNFGHKPPLEGGGIFQFGFQYGGGMEYHLTPRLFVRSDFRQTISPQPDYWTKSYATITALNTSTTGGLQFVLGPQHFGGPLRQNLFTTGIGISF